MFRRAAACVLWASIAAPAVAEPRALRVPAPPSATEVKIEIEPGRRGGPTLLELVDPATGRCVRTLFAAQSATRQTVVITKAAAPPPGKYRLRYREGIVPELTGTLARPGSSAKWLNPTDLFIADQTLYVLEAGLVGLDELRPPALQERTWKPTTGEPVTGLFAGMDATYVRVIKAGQTLSVAVAALSPADLATAKELDKQYRAYMEANSSYIYKFDRDGKLDQSFSEHGRLPVPFNSSTIRSIAVDAQGVVYTPSGGHSVSVLTASPSPPAAEKKEWPVIRNVSSYEGIATSVRETVWVNTTALGPAPRVYISHGGAAVRVYDRTKPLFEGFLYNFNLPLAAGTMPRWLASDPVQSVFYVMDSAGQILKCVDDGKQVVAGPKSDVLDKLVIPTGPSASGGLIAVACHGPGLGPYWDSGGGGEFALYWDDTAGAALRLVGRWGFPGTGPGAMEFLNPSAVAMSADHQELWVAEDGLANKEGPPGNARVRRYRLGAGYAEEADLDLTAWK